MTVLPWLVAVGGVVSGIGGFVVSARQGKKAGEVAGKDAATRATEVAVKALEASLERQGDEIIHLTKRTVELGQRCDGLQAAVERCEAEKSDLRRELEELRA